MDPLTIGSIAAPVIGGLLGQNASSGDSAAARRAMEQALAQYAGITLPSIGDQSLSLQDYVNSGTLSPELLQAISVGDTNLTGVSTDPRLKSSQQQALEQLTNLSNGQLSPGEEAGFTLARNNAAGEMQAKQNQILQEMQQRGQAGSGAELLARLKSNQSGAQMLQDAQLKEAQAVQQAREQALQQQANLASSMRSQDYSENANLANARDAIAKYNAQNSQNVAATNTAAKNNAQGTNLANAQNISNMNTQTANQQQQYNKGLLQQQYNNQMQLAGAKAGILNGQAGQYNQQAANTAGQYSTIGQGVGQLLGGLAKTAAPVKQNFDAYGNPITKV